MDSNAYWAALPTGGWHKVLAGHNCKLWMPAMASSVTEAQSHNKGTCRGGRSVTGVHGSVTGIQNKSVNGAMKKQWAQRCNGGMASQFTAMHTCMVYSWAWESRSTVYVAHVVLYFLSWNGAGSKWPLYIRYRSSSQKNKAECKMLTDYIP